MFRTRQAPSPTGYLHFGTARTMLFTQLIAKKNEGTWFLRIEDTDRLRLQPDAVGSLLGSMDQLGLVPDEGVNNLQKGTQDDFYKIYQDGEYGPYIQSERLEHYHKYAQILIDKKLCYWSYITPQDKEELVTIKQITKKPINYFQANIQKLNNKPLTESTAELNDKVSANLFQSIEQGLKDELKPDLKFKMLKDSILHTEDVLLGKSSFNLALEEDFTCIKSDGYPTYHLAHPVDDTMMKTSLIIRSQEWTSSLPKHVELSKALDFVLPDYMHIPFILGETGNKKMSKRDGNVNIEGYLNKGYMPEAVINYLAFLGWNPGTEKEIYLSNEDFDIDSNISIELQINSRMKKLLNNILLDFDQTKIQKSPARFSIEKLNWYNKEYIKMLTPYEFSYRNATLTGVKMTEDNNRILAHILDTTRVTLLSEATLESDTVNDYRLEDQSIVAWKKITLEESIANLREITPVIESIINKYSTQKSHLLTILNKVNIYQEYSDLQKAIETNIKQWLSDNSKDVGSYLWPLRVILSGQAKSPSPFELLAIINNEEILRRLKNI